MKKYIFLVGMLLFLPLSVNAATANIEFSSTNQGNNILVKAKVSSNEAISSYEYTLDYDNNKLELVEGNPFNNEYSNNNETKSFEKEFKFKIKSSGSSTITATSYAVTSIGNQNMKVNVKPLNVNGEKNSSNSLSDNNNLSSLEIEGFKLNPNFSKDITSYEISIDDGTEKINIKATAEDSKATIKGDGSHILNDGKNEIKITVISQNKDEKTYTILVNVKDKNPLKVTINDKEYTVLKNIESVKAPEGFKLSKTRIKEHDVQSYYNDKIKLTLVALKDENGNVALYIYDDSSDNYSKYFELSNNEFSFIPLNYSKKLEGYRIYTEVINDNEIKCLKLSSHSDYCVLYGLNLNTNKKGLYTYDIKDKTIQRYNKDLEKYNKEKLKNTRILIYILSATTLLFGIMTIVFAVKSSKRR